MYFSETKNLIRPFDINHHLSPAPMKNALHLTLLILMLSGAASAAYGQESGSPSFESYDLENLVERDRVLPSGGAGDPPRQTVRPQRVSVEILTPKRNIFKPSAVVPKDESNPKNQSDDSILSFNFLYYLIQKYKMQDILE